MSTFSVKIVNNESKILIGKANLSYQLTDQRKNNYKFRGDLVSIYPHINFV